MLKHVNSVGNNARTNIKHRLKPPIFQRFLQLKDYRNPKNSNSAVTAAVAVAAATTAAVIVTAYRPYNYISICLEIILIRYSILSFWIVYDCENVYCILNINNCKI